MAESKSADKPLSVDKSAFIETLEKCGVSHVMMLRPHGFGKSHLMDMIFSYYDKSSASAFNEKYAGTFIRMHPTPLKNSFRVMRFVFTDLSGLPEDRFDDAFRTVISSEILDFLRRNPDIDSAVTEDDVRSDPVFAFVNLCLNFSQQCPGEKIYLLIEDYDNFAYDVLFDNRMDLVDNPLVTDFYDSIKSVLNVSVGRTFVTGVFPISFGTLFGENGTNVVRNLAPFRAFAGITGFTRDELSDLLLKSTSRSKGKKSVDDMILELNSKAGGYVFSPYGTDGLYNPRDVEHYLKGGKGDDDKMQKRLNTILDLARAVDHRDVISRIVGGELLKLTNVTPFLKLSLVSSYQSSDVLSLLFYLGYLSMAPDSIKKTGAVALVCPNDHIRGLFRRYFEDKKLDADPEDTDGGF